MTVQIPVVIPRPIRPVRSRSIYAQESYFNQRTSYSLSLFYRKPFNSFNCIKGVRGSGVRLVFVAIIRKKFAIKVVFENEFRFLTCAGYFVFVASNSPVSKQAIVFYTGGMGAVSHGRSFFVLVELQE